MSNFANLSNEELSKIEKQFKSDTQDIFLQKRLSNIDKNSKWISVKNNTKTNKFKSFSDKIKYKTDPYKFRNIPSNIRDIILQLCKKNDIQLQRLSVKANISYHIIYDYLNNNNNNNHFIDNCDLHSILKILDFDLIKHIDNNK